MQGGVVGSARVLTATKWNIHMPRADTSDSHALLVISLFFFFPSQSSVHAFPFNPHSVLQPPVSYIQLSRMKFKLL